MRETISRPIAPANNGTKTASNVCAHVSCIQLNSPENQESARYIDTMPQAAPGEGMPENVRWSSSGSVSALKRARRRTAQHAYNTAAVQSDLVCHSPLP